MDINDLIIRLESQLPEVLSAFLTGIPAESITRRPASGKWSAHENLAHLGRYHEIVLARMDRILSEDSPVFTRYDSAADLQAQDWMHRPTREVLRCMCELRAQLLARVRCLSSDKFERIGVHPLYGPMPLRHWLEFFLVHEGHHLYLVVQRTRESLESHP